MEEAVEKVQRSCLAEMFRVSMDRRRYAAWGAADVDKGEEIALEEIRALEEAPPVRRQRFFIQYLMSFGTLVPFRLLSSNRRCRFLQAVREVGGR